MGVLVSPSVTYDKENVAIVQIQTKRKLPLARSDAVSREHTSPVHRGLNLPNP